MYAACGLCAPSDNNLCRRRRQRRSQPWRQRWRRWRQWQSAVAATSGGGDWRQDNPREHEACGETKKLARRHPAAHSTCKRRTFFSRRNEVKTMRKILTRRAHSVKREATTAAGDRTVSIATRALAAAVAITATSLSPPRSLSLSSSAVAVGKLAKTLQRETSAR